MALSLSLTYVQQSNCGEFVLTDNTGAYNNPSNLGGWGTPNLRLDNGEVTYAEIIIERYSNSYTLTEVETIDVISNWETLTGLTSSPFNTGTTVANLIYTIPTSMVNFTDGAYRITYQVGDGTTYENSTSKATVTYNIATYCNIECCIDQRVANGPTEYECVTCNNEYLSLTTTLWSLLLSLKLAACSASIDKYLNILSTLQTACEQAGCDCQ